MTLLLLWDEGIFYKLKCHPGPGSGIQFLFLDSRLRGNDSGYMINKNEPNLEIMRHSLAHVMAAAVQELWPGTKFGVGPTVENGFYYDMQLPPGRDGAEYRLLPVDLLRIEKRMRDIIHRGDKFIREELPIDEAIKLFGDLKQPFKVELLRDIRTRGTTKIEGHEEIFSDDKSNTVSIYRTGKFVDLCRGPHVESARELPADGLKLHRLAGAYWRGKETNPMLQRVYGLAFEKKAELDERLEFLVEAERRDHRKLGKEMGLFLIDPIVGLGLPLWQPRGALIWRLIEEYWYKQHLESGYDLVRSPHIGHRNLWETSGHWNFYSDSMYPPMEVSKTLEDVKRGRSGAEKKEEYLIKPMNCPFHVQIFKSEPRSYRELPMRFAECGTVYRYEKSGELSGLTRVRGFTQDDAHIICTKEQVEAELKRVVKFIKDIFSTFGFKDYKIYLSLRDPKNKEKYAGNDEGWNFTEAILEKVAKEAKLDYKKEEGEAAFYGPKLDFKIKDALGREWQCSTLQFDFNLPKRFEMKFINADGKEEQPYMLHRALFGSFERFIGLLIEHYVGAFPTWLHPIQVAVIPVGAAHVKPAGKLAGMLKEAGIRVHLDDVNETVGYKIRKAEKFKVPYMLVVGDKEAKLKNLAVRVRGKKEMKKMTVKKFIAGLKKEIMEKSLKTM